MGMHAVTYPPPIQGNTEISKQKEKINGLKGWIRNEKHAKILQIEQW